VVIYTRRAARLVRRGRLDGDPFIIGEFAAQDSRLSFGILNHAPGDAFNPLRPVEAASDPLFYFRFRRFRFAFFGFRLALTRVATGRWPRTIGSDTGL
jgi:hypothetical protein